MQSNAEKHANKAAYTYINRWGIIATNKTTHPAFPSLCVAGVGDTVGRAELLLDRTQADEARHEVGTAGLVVGAASSGTAEWLLANYSTSALAVDVEVSGGIAESAVSEADNGTILSENRSSQGVFAGLVDLLADLGEVGVGGILVAVDNKDGAEELTREEGVVRVGGTVNSWLDIPALGGVVGATCEQFKLRVVLGLINNLGQLGERSLVDDRAAEVGEIRDLTDLQLLSLRYKIIAELIGDRLGHVSTGGGAALLALELEGTTDGLDGRIADVSRLVDDVEVLSTGFTDDARVAAIFALGNSIRNLSIQRAEDAGASGEMKGRELRMVHDGVGNLSGFAGDELDNILGQTSLQQDLVDQPVGRNGGWRWLPNHDITHQGGGTSQIASNGSEVEGADGVDESFQRTIFDTVPNAGRVVCGLLGVHILSILDAEAEEVAQLGGGIDLGLPGVFALPMHGQRHNIITVLGSDQVGGLEEDTGTVGERGIAP